MSKAKRRRFSAEFKVKVALVQHLGCGFLQALREALVRFPIPRIFKTDQGSQFTSLEFSQVLKDAGGRISMDGKGRWVDNVMSERLCRC